MRKILCFLLVGGVLFHFSGQLHADDDSVDLGAWGSLLASAQADVATNTAAVQAAQVAAPAAPVQPPASPADTSPVPVANLVTLPSTVPAQPTTVPAQPAVTPKTHKHHHHKEHHAHNKAPQQGDALQKSIAKSRAIQADNSTINGLLTKWQGIADNAAKQKAQDLANQQRIAQEIAAEQQQLSNLNAQVNAEKAQAAEKTQEEAEAAAKKKAEKEKADQLAAQQAAALAAQRAQEQKEEAATEAAQAKAAAAQAAAQKAAQLRAQQQAAAQARAQQLAQQQAQAAAAAAAQRERQIFSQSRTTPTTFVFQSIEPGCWTISASQSNFAAAKDNGAQYFWYSPSGPVGSGDYAKLVANEESIVFNNRSNNYGFTLGNFNRYGDEITFDVTAVKSPQLSNTRTFNGVQFNVQSGNISSHSAAELDKYLGFNSGTNIAGNAIIPTLKRLIPQSQKFTLPNGREVAWVQIDHQANNALGDAKVNHSDIFVWMLNAQAAWTRLQQVFIGNGGQYIPFVTIENTSYQFKNNRNLISYNGPSVQGFLGKQWKASTNVWRDELGFDDENLADAVFSVLFCMGNGGKFPSEKALMAAAGGTTYNGLTFKSEWEGNDLVCTDTNSGTSITLQFTNTSNYSSNISSNNQHINLTASSNKTGKSINLAFYPGGLYWLLGADNGNPTYCNANHTPTKQSGDLDAAMGYNRGSGLSVVLAIILQFACPVVQN